ncbi:lysophospholipid acyltransferase, partial [Phlyctochytrium bullatum]
MGVVDLTPIVRSTGLDLDVLAPGLILISSYLLCLPFSLLRTPLQRHVFSVIVSGLQYVAFFDFQGYWQLLGLAVACYFVTVWTRGWKGGPVVVFGMSMGLLAVNHLHRQFFNVTTGRVDHTVPMMILVQKVTNFAWSTYDGTLPARLLTPSQTHRRLDTLPTLSEYMGYIFFYPAFLVGPSFDLKAYLDFINDRPPFGPGASRKGKLGRMVGCIAMALAFF